MKTFSQHCDLSQVSKYLSTQNKLVLGSMKNKKKMKYSALIWSKIRTTEL